MRIAKSDKDQAADDDIFTQFAFEKFKKTETLTMQEIFIHEKGQAALRALNITIADKKRIHGASDFEKKGSVKKEELV